MFCRRSTCTASNSELRIEYPGIWKAPWQRTPVLKPKLALGAVQKPWGLFNMLCFGALLVLLVIADRNAPYSIGWMSSLTPTCSR